MPTDTREILSAFPATSRRKAFMHRSTTSGNASGNDENDSELTPTGPCVTPSALATANRQNLFCRSMTTGSESWHEDVSDSRELGSSATGSESHRLASAR